MTTRGLILVIEDDEILGPSLVQRLKLEGWHAQLAPSGRAALAALARQTPDMVICDIRLPDVDGEQLMGDVFARAGAVPTIFMTAHGGVDQAVRLVRAGARDYLIKPFDLDELVAKLESGVRSTERGAETAAPDDARLSPSFGLSPATQATRGVLERVADLDLPVLLLGETGTGKEVAARFLHATSSRNKAPFLAVNCAALAPELVDSALFGHEKGAFTGAHERHQGLAEQAGSGTLFLDEIGELGAGLQAKLLRLVQEREFTRLGGKGAIRFKARLVCATHRDLEAEVAAKSFREDLWYRINVVTVRLPPLRDRAAEIALLLDRFVENAGPRLRGRPMRIADDAPAAAMAYDWPGNIRELENRVERAVALAEADVVTAADLFPDAAAQPPAAVQTTRAGTATAERSMTLAEVRDAAEREHIAQTLQTTDGAIQDAASRLGVSRTTLWEKMRRLGISAG